MIVKSVAVTPDNTFAIWDWMRYQSLRISNITHVKHYCANIIDDIINYWDSSTRNAGKSFPLSEFYK